MANTAFPSTFEAYRRAVNRVVAERTGLGIDDLDDVPLADWFDDRVSPATAARRAIKNAGG